MFVHRKSIFPEMCSGSPRCGSQTEAAKGTSNHRLDKVPPQEVAIGDFGSIDHDRTRGKNDKEPTR